MENERNKIILSIWYTEREEKDNYEKWERGDIVRPAPPRSLGKKSPQLRLVEVIASFTKG